MLVVELLHEASPECKWGILLLPIGLCSLGNINIEPRSLVAEESVFGSTKVIQFRTLCPTLDIVGPLVTRMRLGSGVCR